MIKGTLNRTTNLFVFLIVISFIFPATAIRYAQAATENSQESNITGSGQENSSGLEMNNSRVVAVPKIHSRVTILEMNNRRVAMLEMPHQLVCLRIPHQLVLLKMPHQLVCLRMPHQLVSLWRIAVPGSTQQSNKLLYFHTGLTAAQDMPIQQTRQHNTW